MANTANSRQSSRGNRATITLVLSFLLVGLLGVLVSTPTLAQVRIWELPLDTSISNADSIPFADANSSATPRTKRLTVASIRTTINALDYGLVCDNFTDNHAAIEAAIAACPTHGCIVEIPFTGDGKCKITGDIDIGDGSVSAQSTRHGVTLRGVAWSGNTSEMTVASQKGIQIVWGGAAGGTMLSINGPIMGVTIENLNFVGENGANDAGTAISAFHCAQCTFKNLNISGYTTTAMRINAVGNAGLPSGVVLGGDDNTYENIQVAGPTVDSAVALDLGPSNATGAGAATDNARNFFANCEFRGGTGAAGRGVILRFTDNNTFIQTHFVGGKSIEVIPPTGNASFPVAITCIHCVISGDTLVTGTWTPVSNFGILFLPLAIESGALPTNAQFGGIASDAKFFGFLGGSGVYTPTPVGVTNVAASDCQELQYLRVGATVTVSGLCNVDPTTGSALTTLGIPLPIATNMTANTNLAGTSLNNNGTNINAGRIRADATNDRAQLDFFADAGAATQPHFIHFTYQVK